MPAPLWPRAILLVDMNAFFASIEQQDQPRYRNRPVAITNGWKGSCVITCSYEARAYGVKTGMRLREAKALCPDLIQCPSRPQRYAQVSSTIMTALQDITPDIEVFSVDEAFLDITALQRYLGSPEVIARQVKQTVLDVSGVCCSIGVSGDKTTAKYAAKCQKPNGLTVIHPDAAEAALSGQAVTALCGVNKGIASYLARYGVTRCGEVKHLPISLLAQRFGNPGRRLWYMCQGRDPEPLIQRLPEPKSIGHGKVMPPRTQDIRTLRTFFKHMSEKVAARLRRHRLLARRFFIGLRTEHQWLYRKFRLAQPIQDGRGIMALCEEMLHTTWRGQSAGQVQVTASELQPLRGQMELFEDGDNHQEANRVMDSINQRYGEFALSPARLLDRSDMPNVIAPAWKPHGHRQTIQHDYAVRQRRQHKR